MKPIRYYTIGEIFRQKSLLNSKGKPYSSKGSISNVLRGHPFKSVQSPHGPAKMYSELTIDKINAKWS